MVNCNGNHKLTDHWIMDPGDGGRRRFVKVCKVCGQTIEVQGLVNVGLWSTMSSLAMRVGHAIADMGRQLYGKRNQPNDTDWQDPA